ncbi:MAG: hypothetical protein ABW128_06870 [Rhizorhabdus sp.]
MSEQDDGERVYSDELRALMRITLIPPSSGQEGVVLARKIAADAIGIAKTQPPEADGEGPCEGGAHCCCCGSGEPCCDCGEIMPARTTETGAVTALKEVANEALYVTSCVLAFIGRDKGTDRLDKTLSDLETIAKLADATIRASLTPEKQDSTNPPSEA